jgi:hypothetical protein
MHERYDAAKTFLESNGKILNVIGIMWNQGSSDDSEPAATDYQVNFQDIIDYMRDNILGISNAPIAFCTSPIISAQFNQKVSDAKWAIANNDTNSYICDCYDLPLDPANNLHYQIDGATDLAEIMFDFVKEW